MKSIARYSILTFVLLFLACGGSSDDAVPESESTGVPVEIVKVEAEDIDVTLEMSGVVDALYDADVAAETSGSVKDIVRDVGDRAQMGDPVILLNDETQALNLQQAAASLRVAKAAHEKAQRDLERMESLFDSGDISESEHEQARLLAERAAGEYDLAVATLGLAEKAVRDARIPAPFDGEIAARYVSVGEMVNVGQPAYAIVETDTIRVYIDISAGDLARVYPGQAAELTVGTYSGEVFPGILKAVSSKADLATRTYQAEIQVANPDAMLKPGMLADIRLITRTMYDVVAIPGDAIVERDGESVVFVANGNKASRRSIVITERIGDRVIVTNGVNPGESLIVVGQHGLSDGNKIIITE